MDRDERFRSKDQATNIWTKNCRVVLKFNYYTATNYSHMYRLGDYHTGC